MTQFLLAYLLFLLTHSLPTRPTVRRRLVARLGERPFQLLYAIVSLAMLAWLIAAALAAPFVELWPWAPWQTWLALIVMPPAFALVGIGFLAANPRSISLRAAGPNWRPRGVLMVVRHPLLVGLALWALAHAVVNGDLVSLMLFGGLGLFALVGQRIVAKRRQAGAAAASTTEAPVGSSGTVREQAVGALLGLGLYLGLLLAHPWLFGVDPLAGIR